MNSRLEKKLYRAAASTFEGLGFMFPLAQDEAGEFPQQPDAAVRVEFGGPFSGCLIVRSYGGLAGALAANMLGEFNAPSPQQQHDALGEAANVICGNLLPSIAGRAEVFDLGTPQAVQDPGAPEPRPGQNIAAGVRLMLDQGAVELLLYADERIPVLEE